MPDRHPTPGDVRIAAKKPNTTGQKLSRIVRKSEVESALRYFRAGGGKALYLIRLKAWK